MTDPSVPSGIAPDRPSIARMYDWGLGGTHNFEIDRAFGREVIKKDPTVVYAARENRAFLLRAITFLAGEAGIRQFIDHGSGLPTRRNVHQVAQVIDPSCRVIYIDHDPVVLAHGRAILAENDRVNIITADIGNPEEILGDAEVRRLIDFSQPVGLLFFSVLHCLKDEQDPWGVVRRMFAAAPSGSYLAASAITAHTAEHAETFTRALLEADPTWGRVRMAPEIDRFFDGLDVLSPGLGNVADWRLDLGPSLLPLPESPPDGTEWAPEWRDDVLDPNVRTLWEHGGVARKP